MAFTLPALPYANDALEPHIDAKTMEIHHTKHHQAYVNNLNAAIEKAPELANKSLDDLMRGINSVPEAVRTAVRNNGGGHWNHSMFWQLMGPGKGGEPTGKLADAIKSAFGDFAKFKEQFAAAGAGRFGSGWAWLDQRRRQALDHEHAEPGQSAHGRQDGDPRPRRLGARVLPEVSEQAARLHRGVVERRELGCRVTALRRLILVGCSVNGPSSGPFVFPKVHEGHEERRVLRVLRVLPQRTTEVCGEKPQQIHLGATHR